MRQTTTVAGKRVVLTTSRTGRVTIKPALPKEDELQAAQVTAMRRHPAFGKQFTFAASLEAERRGPKARAKAIRTGMMAGEPDLRLYFTTGRLVLVENKVGKARMQDSQEPRHALLRRLGFTVHVLRAESEDEAVRLLMEIVDGELADATPSAHEIYSPTL